MGLLNTIPGTNLHSELSKVVPVVEEWATRDSPKINPAIASIASSEHPYEHPPNRESLERFFRGQAPGSKDFTLAAGLNPWILELVLGAEPGPWPKSELLLDQISKRFASLILSRA
jgi:hypothetical protein